MPHGLTLASRRPYHTVNEYTAISPPCNFGTSNYPLLPDVDTFANFIAPTAPQCGAHSNTRTQQQMTTSDGHNRKNHSTELCWKRRPCLSSCRSSFISISFIMIASFLAASHLYIFLQFCPGNFALPSRNVSHNMRIWNVRMAQKKYKKVGSSRNDEDGRQIKVKNENECLSQEVANSLRERLRTKSIVTNNIEVHINVSLVWRLDLWNPFAFAQIPNKLYYAHEFFLHILQDFSMHILYKAIVWFSWLVRHNATRWPTQLYLQYTHFEEVL